MKCLKLLAVIVAFAVVAFLPTMANAAPVVKIAAAGSSAVFQATLDDATGLALCGANHWTQSSGGVLHDNRSGLGGNPAIQDEVANVWVTWDGATDGSTATVSCMYVAVDSGIGVRGYMANPRATLFLNGAALSGSAGSNLSLLGGDINLPAPIFALYGGVTPGTVVMNIAFSDVRPEDAQFQVARALSQSAAGSATGLGYGNWPNPYNGAGDANGGACPFFSCVGGATIQSSYKAGEQAVPVMFRLSTLSTDPFSGNAIAGWTTWPVGAVPVLPIVSNQDCSNTGLGSGLAPCTNAAGPWVAGPYAAHNLNRFTAGYLFDGSLTRTVDVLETGDTLAHANCTAKSVKLAVGANDCALAQLQREPLSGTYTTWEYTIVRSHAVQNSQEDSVGAVPPGPPPQPLNIQGANGSQRYRVNGTGEMVNAICGPLAAPAGCAAKGTPVVNGGAVEANRLGYAFWSYGNLKALRGTHGAGVGVNYNTAPPLGHYLTLDGVDGLFNEATDNPDGTLNPPICTALPCPVIPFTHLIDGAYSAWSIVRAIVPSTTAIGDGSAQDTLLAGLNATAIKYSDFLPVTKMHVFRSHRAPNVVGFGVFNGNGCPAPGLQNYDNELGQDAGGAIFNIQSDLDYVIDTNGAAGDCKGINPVNIGLINQAQ